MKKFLLGLLCLILLGYGVAPAQAAWPEKSIQVIVPWNPGGGSDISARIVMDKVSAILGQPIVITNISGAAGLNGSTRVFGAKPDGYTILWEHPANLCAGPMLAKSKFRWTDFVMACSIGTSDNAIIVKKDSKYNTMADLFADIKAHPGEKKWSYGVNAASHFIFLAINEAIGGGLKILPIAGAGDKTRIVNVMGGVCDVTSAGYAAVVPYVQSGDVKILAMTGAERNPLAPNLSTLKDQGIKADSAFLYSAEFPANTPADIVKRFSDAVKQAVEDPTVVELLKKQGIVAKYRDAKETSEIFAREAALYERLAKANNMIK